MRCADGRPRDPRSSRSSRQERLRVAGLPIGAVLPRFGLHVLAVLVGIVLMLPFYWALISSLKEAQEVRRIPIDWWPRVAQWHNYLDVWTVRYFGNWVFNSVFLTTVATAGTLVSSSLAGYAFARFRFRAATCSSP